MQNVLVLVRHGQSEWNKLNLFTGWKDPDLTQKGIEEAIKAGELLRAEGIKFDIAYTSKLIRAQRTLTLLLERQGQTDLETIEDKALNERHYGDLCGLNKDDARKKWGDEQVHQWRRSYETRPPGGESLKDTAARVLPYYEQEIWPKLQTGKNVLVSAHGNSLRALIMHLDKLAPEAVLELNLGTGVPLIYQFNKDGSVKGHHELTA